MVAIVAPRHTDANVAVPGCDVGVKRPVSCSDSMATEGHWVKPEELPTDEALRETHAGIDRLLDKPRRVLTAVEARSGSKGRRRYVWVVAANGSRL